ncbi:hypothetical protein [Polaromonas sp. JS666]|uniref:hypothetical protein n=1 Tax=Polaromonas sp. (strain JS666 / ATCC BAA-500) TaxID=296591 RepID=UPI0002E5D79A|nr:hypothetical protein [Polaromonas sp. JS666]
MLKEEQAAELLRRCEAIAGRTLPMLRGNLRRSSTRVAAVWEMIVVEAASQLGRIEYEDPKGGPDIKLYFSDERFVWIEVTYLHERFAEEERRSRAVSDWVHEEAQRIGFDGDVRCDFFGDVNNLAGPVRTVPPMDKRKVFLRDPEVAAFFNVLKSRQFAEHKTTLTRWTVTLSATPKRSRFQSGGGLVQESPKTIEEHAAYRALLGKRRQHKVDGPRVVCMGSDTSRAVSPTSSTQPFRLEDALSAALSKAGAISGVFVAQISDVQDFVHGWSRIAKATFYPVSDRHCRSPLSQDEIQKLGRLNFNRWAYAFTLDRWTEDPPKHMIRTTNRLIIRLQGTGAVKISIPGSQLVDILAGRGSLTSACSMPGDPPDQMLSKLLSGALKIVDSKVIPGNLEQGLSELVELTLVPSHEQVYERKKRSSE